MSSEHDTSRDMPEVLLRAFPPSRDELLLSVSRRVTNDMLVEISEADYGMNAEENLEQLRLIRDRNYVFSVMRWEPKEVLELIRWSEPADPKWKPGSTGERGHIMRAFACAALLRAATEPKNSGYFGGENQTLAGLIDSALFIGEELPETVARFLTWRIPQLASDEECPFFAFGLFCLAVLIGGEPVSSSNAAELARWVELEEYGEQQAIGSPLPHETYGWLLGLTYYDLRHPTWRSIARRVHAQAEAMSDTEARKRIQSVAARITSG